MVTLNQIFIELLYPIFDFLAVILRGLGTLGAGFVAGRAFRYTLAHKFKMRFYVPLMFLGTVALFGVAGYARWSSPGAFAMLGIGVFLGYMLKARGGSQEAAPETELDDYYDESDEASS